MPNKDKLKALGSKTPYPTKPSIKILEVFDTPSSAPFYVTFTQEGEFTSKCPITAQPDFGSIRILFLPHKKCVESKSLKLYLGSYRNQGGFGEELTNKIANDLAGVLDPKLLVVIGDFKPRGGIGWKTKAVRIQAHYSLTQLDMQEIANFK